MVGCFSIYHLYCTGSNSTTIEGWEKDRVATMIRRGTIREVKYPYVSRLVSETRGQPLTLYHSQNVGLVQNFRAVLGPNALLWLWPQKMQGTGLSYPVSMKLDGEFVLSLTLAGSCRAVRTSSVRYPSRR